MLVCFFAPFINTLSGVVHVNEEKLELFRSLGVSKLQSLRKLVLPDAVPVIMAGGRLALTAALTIAVGAVSAQMTVDMINPLPRSTNFFPLVVGEELGYFADEGVEVNLVPSDTSIPYVAFIQNGQADLAMLDPFKTVNARLAGAEINTVFEVMQNAPEGIAVPAASQAQTVADLVGTTVGLVSDRDRAFLQAALATAGHSLDEVQTVVLGEAGPTLAAVMRDGTVSAISGAAPDWIALIANGIETRLITPEEWEIPEVGQLFLDMSIGMNVSVTERCGDVQPDVWSSIQPQMKAAGGIEEIVPVEDFLNDSYIEAANDFDRDQVAADIDAWEETGALVMIHPNGFTEGARFHDYYLSNVLGNPLETATALHYLIFNGVLERIPDFKILAVHGGYLPAYSGRIDHAWGARKDCRGDLPKPPTASLKMFEKDLAVIGEDLRRLGLDVLLFDAVDGLYKKARASLPETHDTAAVFEV